MISTTNQPHTHAAVPPLSKSTNQLVDNSTNKDRAKEMFILGNKSQTAIAAELNIHPKTVAYWIKQNNWADTKENLRLCPIIVKQNIYAQVLALQYDILTRDGGNSMPDKNEVAMQHRLLMTLFKMEDYSNTEMEGIYMQQRLEKSQPQTDKKFTGKTAESIQNIENQHFNKNEAGKEGIKMDKKGIKEAGPDEVKVGTETTAYTPKKNVILRSGVRWIEKDTVYDPATRKQRALRYSEYEELIKKGITKADFQGWVPGA